MSGRLVNRSPKQDSRLRKLFRIMNEKWTFSSMRFEITNKNSLKCRSHHQHQSTKSKRLYFHTLTLFQSHPHLHTHTHIQKKINERDKLYSEYKDKQKALIAAKKDPSKEMAVHMMRTIKQKKLKNGEELREIV